VTKEEAEKFSADLELEADRARARRENPERPMWTESAGYAYEEGIEKGLRLARKWFHQAAGLPDVDG
jgi:hypothetical protein